LKGLGEMIFHDYETNRKKRMNWYDRHNHKYTWRFKSSGLHL
jgi:hypothetical protein